MRLILSFSDLPEFVCLCTRLKNCPFENNGLSGMIPLGSVLSFLSTLRWRHQGHSLFPPCPVHHRSKTLYTSIGPIHTFDFGTMTDKPHFLSHFNSYSSSKKRAHVYPIMVIDSFLPNVVFESQPVQFTPDT